MVIVFGSRKGGVGKTTLAIALFLRLLKYLDHRVFLIDGDSQKSLSIWATHFMDNKHLLPLFRSKDKVNDDIKRFMGSKDSHVIIDVSGRDSAALRHSLLIADIWFCPYTYSLVDINTMLHMDKIYEEIKRLTTRTNPNPLQRVNIMNRMPTDTRRTKALKDMGDVLKTHIAVFDRAFYRRLFEGKLNWEDPKAQDEIDSITELIVEGV